MNRNMAINHIEKDLEQIAEKNKTVSISVAVVRKDQVIWTHALGYSNREKQLLASPETIYRVASVSKHVSALAAMTLVDVGKASLDTDISEYLGYNVRNPFYPDIAITLRHLMTHTSTLSEAGNYSRICAGELPPYPLSQILVKGTPGYSQNNYINAKPGEKYVYSSFGSGIMGTIIECITKKKFADYAKEVILTPLGLDSSYNPDDLSDLSLLATPYEVAIADNIAEDTIAANPDWLKNSLANKMKLANLPVGEAYRMAQGNLHIRPRDLAAITMVLLNEGHSKGVQILSPQAAAEMTKVQFRDENICTGLNLHIWDRLVAGKHMIGHPGRAYGAFSSFFFCPEDKTAVIVFTNGTDPNKDDFYCTSTCTAVIRAIYKLINCL